MLAAEDPGIMRVKMLGPIEAPLSRIANRHRWQLLISSSDIAGLHRLVHKLIFGPDAAPVGRGITVSVDVDPFFLM
jgi:primosomal protein N' (replication factor Y)